MVPSRQYRGAVLPWEKQLMDSLGMSPEEYAWYISEIANIRISEIFLHIIIDDDE